MPATDLTIQLDGLVRALEAARSRRTGVDVPALDATIAVLRQDYPVLSPAKRKATGPDRLASLADVAGLDDIERHLLLAAVAPDLDANVALAYDALIGGNEGAGARATIGLAAELCGAGDIDIRARLHASSRLRSSHLLEIRGDGPWPVRRLRVPDRVVDHLAGVDRLEPVVAQALTEIVDLDLEEAHQLSDAIRSGTPLVWIYGPRGTAGSAVAAAACRRLGLSWLAVSLRRTQSGSDASDLITRAGREALLRGCVLIILDAQVAADHGGPHPLVALDDLVVPVIAIAHDDWRSSWAAHAPLRLPAPVATRAARAELWHRTVPHTAVVDEALAAGLAALRLSPEDIPAIARDAHAVARAAGRELAAPDLRDAARRSGAGSGQISTTGGQARRPGFDDLVLPRYALDALTRLVAWGRVRDAVLDQGPVHGKGGKGTGLSALFTGSPGTGKTLAAHVVAEELGLDLMQVDLSRVVSKYIGETEKNLAAVFHDAERLDVLLFFDEADAMFGRRSEVRDARDRYANQEVSYLLQRMEQFDGITVLATNLKGNLDPAFSRRLSMVIHFPDPDAATRERLWSYHFAAVRDRDPDAPPDAAALAATVDVAGGDIRNIVLAATYDAAAAGLPLAMRHVTAAAARELVKMGRRVPKLALFAGLGDEEPGADA